jgi:hypothetical protein
MSTFARPKVQVRARQHCQAWQCRHSPFRTEKPIRRYSFRVFDVRLLASGPKQTVWRSWSLLRSKDSLRTAHLLTQWAYGARAAHTPRASCACGLGKLLRRLKVRIVSREAPALPTPSHVSEFISLEGSDIDLSLPVRRTISSTHVCWLSITYYLLSVVPVYTCRQQGATKRAHVHSACSCTCWQSITLDYQNDVLFVTACFFLAGPLDSVWHPSASDSTGCVRCVLGPSVWWRSCGRPRNCNSVGCGSSCSCIRKYWVGCPTWGHQPACRLCQQDGHRFANKCAR